MGPTDGSIWRVTLEWVGDSYTHAAAHSTGTDLRVQSQTHSLRGSSRAVHFCRRGVRLSRREVVEDCTRLPAIQCRWPGVKLSWIHLQRRGVRAGELSPLPSR